MTEKKHLSEMGRKIERGIFLARKRMLHEKALHGQDLILADDNGNIVRVPAKDIIANHKEFQ